MKENSTTARRTALSQGGSMDGKGDGTGADSGRPGAVCGAVPPQDGALLATLPGKPLRAILRQNTDSLNAWPLDQIDRLAALDLIETEIRTLKRQSQADFLHAQRKIRAACLTLDLTGDQRARLAACPLASKGERLSELIELQHFLASQ